MRSGWIVVGAALWSLASRAVAAPLDVPLPAGCLHRSELAAAEFEKLGRFFVLRGGYDEWTRMDCYPRRVEPSELASSVSSGVLGFVTPLGGGDAYVFDLGETWLQDCARSRGLSADSEPVAGSDLLDLKRAVDASPLARVDLREVGISKGRLRDGKPLYALNLGTREHSLFLQCYDDLGAAVERAAREIGRGSR